MTKWRESNIQTASEYLYTGQDSHEKILPNQKIVLNLGAGVAVEKDKDSAINYLEARIKEIEVALQDNTAKKQDAAASLEQGKAQINQLMQATPRQNSG